VETKAHLCFLRKVGGRCGCVYGTEGAVVRKSFGTAGLEGRNMSGLSCAFMLTDAHARFFFCITNSVSDIHA
jgi:hypothetical protein